MGKFLRLVNGVPRMIDESGTPTIYDESLNVVASGAGAGEIDEADAETGDPITLPSAQTYEALELEVWLNNFRMEDIADYNYVGAGPARTQIAFTFDLVAGDTIKFRIDRGA